MFDSSFQNVYFILFRLRLHGLLARSPVNNVGLIICFQTILNTHKSCAPGGNMKV
jgi:hypothetical protein